MLGKMKIFKLVVTGFILTCSLRASDTVLGNIVAVERKVQVNLADCEKTWNSILCQCHVTTTENGNTTDFALPGQEIYKRFVVNETKCGVGLSLNIQTNGYQGYRIHYVTSEGGRVPFAVARPCLARALQETGGVITANVYTLK